MAAEPEKTEMLIEQVKSHRMLYDKSHENFKDVGTKNKLWNMIAKNMEESDGVALKNRWKNLRDNYIKYLRSNKPNHGLPQKLVKQYKTWAWAPHMAFIKPYLTYIPRTRIQRDPLTQSPSHEGIEEDETIDNTRARAQPQPQQQTRKRPLEQNTPQVSTTCETPVDKVINYLSKKQKDYDDIDLIFMGYAKTVKKMSKSRQASVKFEIAKIIMESELQENEEASSLMDVKNFHHNQDDNGFYFQNV